jgi:hypothetical protein
MCQNLIREDMEMRKGMRLLCGLSAVLLVQGIAAGAGVSTAVVQQTQVLSVFASPGTSSMRLVQSRPYVMGYRVEGNFVLPVMGKIQNGVIMTVNGYDNRDQTSVSLLYYRSSREDINKFFSSPETVAWVAEGSSAKTALQSPPAQPTAPAATAAPAAPAAQAAPAPPAAQATPAAPVAAGQVVLTGELKVTLEGRLCLVVAVDGGEKRYDLSSNEHFKETVPMLGIQRFRGHFTGTVSPGDPYPNFYVESGWVEPL